MNSNNSQIMMIGKSGYKKMEVKNTVANMYHSMLIMEISCLSSEAQFKKLQSYLKKITDHPVVFIRTSENIHLLITKDNIIKQLLTKPKFR